MIETLPHAPEAEESVIGHMLESPNTIADVVATGLERQHFYLAANGLLYDTLVDDFFADDPIDALTVGERLAKKLAAAWSLEERDAVARVQRMAAVAAGMGRALEHATIVKRHADYRELLKMSRSLLADIETESADPVQLASQFAERASLLASGAVASEVLSFGDNGRRYIKGLRYRIAARDAGIELGAKFGIPAIDAYTRGMKPGELMVCGGEPGTGKSALWWRAALNFGERQAKRPDDQRLGCLVLSFEMPEEPSNDRYAQMLAGIDGSHLREAEVTGPEMERLVANWRERQDVPLFFNYAPSLTTSQIKALVASEIRKHNVGVVIIDHFRMFELDQRLRDKNDEDEEKVKFLKLRLARELNVAVVCLAHTRKTNDRSEGRPTMSDLRGSGMISAFADFVSFVYRPWMYASDDERETGEVKQTDAQLLWEKNRHGLKGEVDFFFRPETMTVL